LLCFLKTTAILSPSLGNPPCSILKTTAFDDRMTITDIVRNKKFQNSNLETNEVKEKVTHLWNWLQL